MIFRIAKISEERVSLSGFPRIRRDARIVLVVLILERTVFKVLEARVRFGPSASVPGRRPVRRDRRDTFQNLLRSPLAVFATRDIALGEELYLLYNYDDEG